MENEKQLEDLLAKQKAVQDEIDEFVRRERSVTLRRVQMFVEKFGFTVQEVFEHIPKVKLPAKYRDPATGDEWTGRGKLPLWLQGKNKDDFLVK